MEALHKFNQSWLLRDNYHGWFYRFASSIGIGMSSLPTNNGLEGTNNMIKKDYTQRELLGISRFLLLVEQYIHDCSTDSERKVPVRVPTIPRNVNCTIQKSMESLKIEDREAIYFQFNEEHIWLIGSSSYHGNGEGLIVLWKDLEEAKYSMEAMFNYSSWQRYKQLRSLFYTLKKSNCFSGYISCTCPKGIKDEFCKHSLMVMEPERLAAACGKAEERAQKKNWPCA